MASVSRKSVTVCDKNVQHKNIDKFKNELTKRLERRSNPPDFPTKLPTAPIHSSSGDIANDYLQIIFHLN